jgi:hypothetical protein
VNLLKLYIAYISSVIVVGYLTTSPVVGFDFKVIALVNPNSNRDVWMPAIVDIFICNTNRREC